MNRPAKRRILWTVAGIAVVAGGLWGYRTYKADDDAAIQYQVATVERADLASQVTASGTLSPLVTVQVGSQVSGRIQALYADFNTRVEKGKVIAKIDPSIFVTEVAKAKANLTSARAAVTRAEAERDQARRNHERASALADKKLVAQADADTALAAYQGAQAQLASARASITQARAAVTQAETNLAYTTIISPISGIVITRSVDVGQTVAASLQAPTLFTIAEDLAKMEVHTTVAESDVGRLRQGMDVEFTVDAYPSDRFRATVKEVRYSPQTVQNVVTYDAVVSVDNGDLKLRPGMTADVTFQVEKRDDALVVPNTALRFRPPQDVLDQIGWKPPQAGAGGRGERRGRMAGATAGAEPTSPGGVARPASGEAAAASGEAAAASGEAAAASGEARPASGEGRGRRGGGERANRRLVWKMGANGMPEPAMVVVGISDGRNTEIVGGLAEGDTILTGIGAQPAASEQQGQGGNRGGGRSRRGRFL